MTKKIEGFTVKDGGEIPNITPFPPNDYPQCVTVVLHEHRHERVFTESEVRAKDEDLKWALNWINNEARYLRERGKPQEALEIAIDMVLERHGIDLDPA